MLRRLLIVLIALNVSAPNLFAEGAATPIRTSVAAVKFDFTRSSTLATTPRRQRKSRQRVNRDAAIVVGLTMLGLYAGMILTSRIVLPCHCDDAESVVARGGVVGAAAGAIVGIVITSR